MFPGSNVDCPRPDTTVLSVWPCNWKASDSSSYFYLSLIKPSSYHSPDTLRLKFSPSLPPFFHSFCPFMHYYFLDQIMGRWGRFSVCVGRGVCLTPILSNLFLSFVFFLFTILNLLLQSLAILFIFHHPFLIPSSSLSLLGQQSERLLISCSSYSYFS